MYSHENDKKIIRVTLTTTLVNWEIKMEDYF